MLTLSGLMVFQQLSPAVSGSQVWSHWVKQPCKIRNKCQCLAWAAVWFCVWENSIQEHALCPYSCLGVSEDTMGRNVEFGGKYGASRSLAPLLFWSQRDLQQMWCIAPKSLPSSCLMTVWAPCWDEICAHPWDSGGTKVLLPNALLAMLCRFQESIRK